MNMRRRRSNSPQPSEGRAVRKKWAEMKPLERFGVVFGVLFGAGAAALIAILLIPLRWEPDLRFATPDEQSAAAATAQAVGVVATLILAALGFSVAALTLASNQRDARVDRVLGFHVELTGPGPTGVGRSRLARFLRERGTAPWVRYQVGIQQLLHDPQLNSYPQAYGAGTTTPHMDLMLVLRLFERIRVAQVAGLLDDRLIASLVGRHAGWWDLAIKDDSEDTQRVPVAYLANWCNRYRNEYKSSSDEDPEGFENWWTDRQRAFPPSRRIVAAKRALNKGLRTAVSIETLRIERAELRDLDRRNVLTKEEFKYCEELLKKPGREVVTGAEMDLAPRSESEILKPPPRPVPPSAAWAQWSLVRVFRRRNPAER